MNKKLLAVAIGAALTAPMYAANAAVTVGGQAHLSADYVDQFDGGTSTDSHKVWNISSNVSNIFFKGEEDLGGGLKGVFFLQEYFRLDNNGGAAPTSATGASNRMFDAPAYAGLSSSSFGSILLGNMDGPAKLNGRAVDLFGNQIGDSRNVGADNTRFQNAIAYVSPTFVGITATLAHSTNVDNTIAAPDAATAGATPAAKQLYGTAIGVKWENGPVMVGGTYTMVNDRLSTAGATYKTTDLYNVAASFKFAGARIVGFYQGGTAYSVVAGPTGTINNGTMNNTDGSDSSVYGLGASYTFGSETITAQWYSLTNKATGKSDISSNVYALGYDHAFSKTFTGYVAVAFASNDAGSATTAVANNNAGMSAGGGHGDQPANVNGGDQNGLSLGIIYNF